MSDRSILMISGSLRPGSTNTAAIRAAAASCAPHIGATIYDELGDLPHFNPDVEARELPEVVARLRRQIRLASAVLICTPEYAGDLPGSFKNLLDWTVGGVEGLGKPTAWINVSSNPTRARGAHAALRTVLTYTGAAIVEDACREIPVGRYDVAEDGRIVNTLVLEQIRDAVGVLIG